MAEEIKSYAIPFKYRYQEYLLLKWIEIAGLRERNLTDKSGGYGEKYMNEFKAKLIALFEVIKSNIKDKADVEIYDKYSSSPEQMTDDGAVRFYLKMEELLYKFRLTKLGFGEEHIT